MIRHDNGMVEDSIYVPLESLRRRIYGAFRDSSTRYFDETEAACWCLDDDRMELGACLSFVSRIWDWANGEKGGRREEWNRCRM